MKLARLMAMTLALSFYAFQYSSACGDEPCGPGTKEVCIDNTTGCNVRVTINYTCNGQNFTSTFVASPAEPTGICIGSDCCVTSAVFFYATGGSSATVTMTAPGQSYCLGVCTQCTTTVCVSWNADSDCDNEPGYSFGIGCES